MPVARPAESKPPTFLTAAGRVQRAELLSGGKPWRSNKRRLQGPC